jgi:hypothetical protein
MEKYVMTQDDVVCSLNFQKYLVMKKDEMTWDDLTYLYVERIKINDLQRVIEI